MDVDLVPQAAIAGVYRRLRFVHFLAAIDSTSRRDPMPPIRIQWARTASSTYGMGT
jgi:hypothetical protein